jgi:hypothetical protein
MRDGDAGMTFDYSLNVVPTGVDEDGDPVTTCVVESVEPPKLVGEIPKKKGALRDFMCVLREAVMEGGGTPRVEEVRLRFFVKRGDAKEPAKREAWKRALEEAVEGGLAEIGEDKERIWLTT